jgi:stage II sporulation protein D
MPKVAAGGAKSGRDSGGSAVDRGRSRRYLWTKMRILSGSVRRWRLLAVAAPLLTALAGCHAPEPHAPAPAAITLPNTVSVRVRGQIRTVPLDDYVLGSALAEVTPITESAATAARIYDVQTVLARTYAVSHLGRHRAEGFDLCDGTHCQLYAPDRLATSRFATIAREAVRRTAGMIVAYGPRPAETLFHADCGGSTTAAEAVWGQPVPYLLPTRDDLPLAAHRSWSVQVTGDEMRNALNADTRTRIGRTLLRLDVKDRDVSGRAEHVRLEGDRDLLVRGEDFRSVLNQKLGDRGIQSTRFTITRSGSTYIFKGQGFGHGVGLCQLGAAARARRGDSLESILAAYFSGTRLVRTSLPR